MVFHPAAEVGSRRVTGKGGVGDAGGGGEGVGHPAALVSRVAGKGGVGDAGGGGGDV
ncbi:MAG: hypothetical protein RIR11_1289 [Bacteroidota bacterium]